MITAYPEPDEHWKAQLKARIDENLNQLLIDASKSYEQKLHAAPVSDENLRRRLYLDHLQTVQNLKTFAGDEYTYAIQRERQEMEWCLQAEVSVEFADALREEQYAALEAIHDDSAQPAQDKPQSEASLHLPLGPAFENYSLIYSPCPSPSPPPTPPLSSGASTSAESSAPSPQPSVVDEEARIRAEKHAKQQEEFRKRAEEIKNRNQEKKRLRQLEVQQEEQQRWASSADSSETSFSSDDDARYTSSSPPPTSPPTPLGPSPVSLPQTGMMSEEDMIRVFIFHDQQWTRIASYRTLHWSDFPWPVLSFTGPANEQELTLRAVSTYILSAFDWHQDKARSKERLREHIRKWHPDRFEVKFLTRVPEAAGERERVRQASGLVARFLTELLGRFNGLEA